MVETVNLDDFGHHLGLVEVVPIPETPVSTRRSYWSLSGLDIAPDLVEIRVDAAERRQSHQPGTPLDGHRRAICSQIDNPARLGLRMIGPVVWGTDRMPGQALRNFPINLLLEHEPGKRIELVLG